MRGCMFGRHAICLARSLAGGGGNRVGPPIDRGLSLCKLVGISAEECFRDGGVVGSRPEVGVGDVGSLCARCRRNALWSAGERSWLKTSSLSRMSEQWRYRGDGSCRDSALSKQIGQQPILPTTPSLRATPPQRGITLAPRLKLVRTAEPWQDSRIMRTLSRSLPTGRQKRRASDLLSIGSSEEKSTKKPPTPNGVEGFKTRLEG